MIAEEPQMEKKRLKELEVKGINAWLSAKPMNIRGRYLTKHEFQDALQTTVGVRPNGLAETCACGGINNPIHTRNCHIGGYINMRHDKIRDYIHTKASSIYKDVEKEPELKPINDQNLAQGRNTADGARTDIRIRSFDRELHDTHIDVKVINLQADAHKSLEPKEAISKAEQGKVKLYRDRLSKV